MNKMIRLMDRMMFKVVPNCREAMKLQSLELDREIPLHRRLRLRMHCLLCRYCDRYGKQIRWIRDLLLELPERFDFARIGKMPPEVRERIVKRLRREREKGQ